MRAPTVSMATCGAGRSFDRAAVSLASFMFDSYRTERGSAGSIVQARAVIKLTRRYRARFCAFMDDLLIDAARQKAAVDCKDLAGDEARGIGRQEDRGAGELVDVAEALHRRAHKKLATTLGLVQ